MPRGEKSAYTDKQKRQAQHIEESEKERGRSEEEAERIAWSTVNGQQTRWWRQEKENVPLNRIHVDESMGQIQRPSIIKL